MRQALIINHPWGKSWESLYTKEFENFGYDTVDWDGVSPDHIGVSPSIVFSQWSDRDFTEMFPSSKHAMVMRRFEFYYYRHKINWDKIDLLVCCNPWVAEVMSDYLKDTKTTVVHIRNSIDTSLWTYRMRKPGKNIGMVGRFHFVKNYPLAAQIIATLPDDYRLHIVGKPDHPELFPYLMSFGKKIIMYDPIPRDQLDAWWEDKSFCLSTSISEGDPMCVLEAMAKGIKPVIHSWPGADQMYPKTFRTVYQAVEDILSSKYDSQAYLNNVEQNNSVGNIHDLVGFIDSRL